MRHLRSCTWSTSATWRPTGSSRSAGGATRPTTRAGATPWWTGWRAWSSGTRTVPAWSCGRSATRAAPGPTWPRWPPGLGSATRRGRCTTRATGRARTSTSTAACTRPTPRSIESAAARRSRWTTPGWTPGAGRCRSSSASTATPWATGPGGLWEYQDLFERHPRCQGGFVWEWIDHGLRARTADGAAFFAYGGDFGEPLHDGNFVADGLLFPDRTPSPGLAELKKVVEPVRVTADPPAGPVANLHDFRDLSHLAFMAPGGGGTAGGLRPPGGPAPRPRVGRHRRPPDPAANHRRVLAHRPGRTRHRPPLGPRRPRGRLQASCLAAHGRRRLVPQSRRAPSTTPRSHGPAWHPPGPEPGPRWEA